MSNYLKLVFKPIFYSSSELIVDDHRQCACHCHLNYIFSLFMIILLKYYFKYADNDYYDENDDYYIVDSVVKMWGFDGKS